MVVVGDEMQGIYSFKEADSRYLTMAEHIFSSKLGMLIAVSTIYLNELKLMYQGIVIIFVNEYS